VVVGRGFECLDLGFELFILGFEFAVILDELVELLADPVCVAGGAPSLLAAVLDERVAMFLLLCIGEGYKPL
jgi:hypothetical protein